MMRKWILICLLVGLHCVARGQTEYAYRYWLDQAVRAEYGGTAADSVWTLELDVDTLSEGFHQLHLQVKDTAGVWSAPQSRFFMKLMPTDVNDLKLRYWFDDAKEVYEIAGASGVHTIDVNDLAWGLHSVSYQVAGHNGIYSSATTAMFMKARMKDDTYTAQCYVGDSLYQEQTMTAEGGIVSWDLDVASLPIGLHPLRLQVNDPDGTTVSVEQSFFVRNHLNGDTYTAQCYVGDSLYNEQVLPSEGGLLDWNLDVASLPRGLHPLRLQVNDSKGTILSVAQSFFWREHTDDERGHERCFYTVDGGRTINEAPEVAEGGYQFDVDLSPLNEGIHQLLCLIVSEEGEVLHSCNRFFMVSRPKVLRYEYWVNDDTLNTKNIIAQPMEPYKMMEMLDVDVYPIRPASFHFTMEDGKPYIYAKNNLNVKFYSTNGACVTDGRAYADVRTRREVSDALLLEAYKPRTDATPEADSIRWYKLQAYANSSLTLLVSQPCTVQLFSPEGEELQYVSGEESVDSIRCHISADGTYYVALHSVTGDDVQTTIKYLRENSQLYRVEYFVDGEFYAADSVARGDNVIAIADPVKENRTFSGWRDLPAIMPDSNVTAWGGFEYMVDYIVADTTLWRTGYFYGDDIDDSPELEKEWYEFEEWSGLPETMPAKDIAVIAKFFFLLELGDVNGDDRISVADITVLTNHIMKLPNTQFVRDAADVNGDGRISVVDVTMTTNKILNNED